VLPNFDRGVHVGTGLDEQRAQVARRVCSEVPVTFKGLRPARTLTATSSRQSRCRFFGFSRLGAIRPMSFAQPSCSWSSAEKGQGHGASYTVCVPPWKVTDVGHFLRRSFSRWKEPFMSAARIRHDGSRRMMSTAVPSRGLASLDMHFQAQLGPLFFLQRRCVDQRCVCVQFTFASLTDLGRGGR